MRFIGDIHGNIPRWAEIIDGVDASIQLGDFGHGFLRGGNRALAQGILSEGRHRFIRGNHDDPAECARHRGWIEDGHYDQEHDMFFLGGAWSIDRGIRTPGLNWWRDEELGLEELDHQINCYSHAAPRIMVTHDAPERISYELFIKGTCKAHYQTRTGQALQQMLDEHRPALWIFGHWHEPRNTVIDGTRFICLAEHAYIDINLTTLEGSR